jgi:hypothetical protein
MRLYVPLTRTEYDQLRDLALIERRRPQDQAAMLLARALADEPARPATDRAPTPSIAETRSCAPTETDHVRA